MIEELKKTIAAKLDEAQVPVMSDRRPHQAPLSASTRSCKRQKIELDQVYDFVALRIITQSVKDCYAALGIIHQTWSPVPGRIKDFIAMPRPNGYQSLHTSVISERGLSVRGADPHRGDAPASPRKASRRTGNTRKAASAPTRDEQYFQWLRQLLEWQQEVRDPQEFLQNLKIELYPEEVYIFTPKGEVKALPRGATPVDFAYAIHTDVGHQCVGARVNGKMVPLRTRLQNGDIVEIITHAGPQAEPRLAELRRHVARAQQDQALHPRRGEGAQHRARAASCSRRKRAASASNLKTLLESDELRARSPTEYGAAKAGRAVRGDRLRQAVGRRRCSRSWCRRTQLKEKPRRSGAIASVVRRVLGAAATTRSRCAASTT